jgi:hypothetical protein
LTTLLFAAAAHQLRSAWISCHIAVSGAPAGDTDMRRRPVRFILIVVAMPAAMLFDLRASQAVQRPWCAGTNRGGGTFSYNCTIPTFEMCVQEVIAGNRGFCSPNPYYRGPEGPPPKGKRKRYYY